MSLLLSEKNTKDAGKDQGPKWNLKTGGARDRIHAYSTGVDFGIACVTSALNPDIIGLEFRAKAQALSSLTGSSASLFACDGSH
mmetsp:Transcript_24823/g.38978  ORF Transcript_24823/g.38978 Transcript_24823/m.38978 type:complete len:84 (+) Transcript_24823:220-471(+)